MNEKFKGLRWDYVNAVRDVLGLERYEVPKVLHPMLDPNQDAQQPTDGL